ncbi:MAG: 50S ribosomal protein L25/general stress protein Ctc, partial [Oscillospiraceae bacterium]
MDVLTVQKRNPEIKAKKLRHSGLVPGIVFGGHLQDSIPVQMDD